MERITRTGRLTRGSYDSTKNCGFDILSDWGFTRFTKEQWEKGGAKANKLLSPKGYTIANDLANVLSDRVSLEDRRKAMQEEDYWENTISLRGTPSPMQMATLNEAQRQEYEEVLFSWGFKHIFSWQNWREGHTVHLYVNATHDVTDLPELWTQRGGTILKEDPDHPMFHETPTIGGRKEEDNAKAT